MSILSQQGEFIVKDPAIDLSGAGTFLTKFNVDGQLTVTGIKEEPDRYVSDKPIEVTSNSVLVGKNVTLSDTASFLAIYSQAFGQRKFFPESLYRSSSEDLSLYEFGDGNRARRVFPYPERTQLNFPLFNETNATQSVEFLYATETNLMVREVMLKLSAETENVRFIVQYFNGSEFKTVWESHNEVQYENGGGYTLTPDGGDNVTIDVSDAINTAVNFGLAPNPSPVIFKAILETTDTVLPLLGSTFDVGLGSQFYPYLAITAQDWEYTDIPDWFDVKPDGFGTADSTPRLITQDTMEVAKEGGTVEATAKQIVIDGTEVGSDFGIEWVHQDGDAILETLKFKFSSTLDKVQFQLYSNEDVKFKKIFKEVDINATDISVDYTDVQAMLRNGVTYRCDIFVPDAVNETVEIQSDSTTQPYFTMDIKILDIKRLDELAPFNYFYTSASSISTITTNSNFDTSPVDIINTTVDIPEDGFYIVEATGFGGCSATNRRNTIDLEVDSVSVLTDPFEKESKDTNDVYSWTIRTEQNLTAGNHDFDLVFGRRGGTGSATVFVQDVWLTIKRVA